MPADQTTAMLPKGDGKETCCLCYELKVGLKIIAYLTIIEAIIILSMAAMVLLSGTEMWWLGLVLLVAFILPLWTAKMWWAWIKEDN